MSAVQDYLAWHYIHASARLLSKALVDENFRLLRPDPYRRRATKTALETMRLGNRRRTGRGAWDGNSSRRLSDAEGKERTLKMVGEIEREMGARYRLADLDEPGD